MKRLIRRLISRLTMKNTGTCSFVDSVNGREVLVYEDCYGEKYLAQSKWEMRILKN